MKYYHCILIILIISCSQEKKQIELKYQPFSKSVIQLIVNSPFVDTVHVYANANTNIPRSGVRSNELTMKESGVYFLTVENDRPSRGILRIQNEDQNIILFPNDTTRLEFILDQNKVSIDPSGIGENINNYFLNKKQKFGYTDIRQPIGGIMTLSSTYNSIKKATDLITDRELLFLNNYTTSYSLPEWFIDYERAEIIYAGAAYKIKRPEYNDRKKIFSDSLPDDYFDFLSKVQIDNQEAIFSTHYMTFLDYFFTKDLSMDKIREMSNFEGGIAFQSHILNRSKNELSGHAKEVYQKRNFTNMVMFYVNLKEIDSLAIEYEISEYENLLDVSGTRLKERIHPLNIQRGDIMPDFQLINQLEDTVSFRNFNKQIVYIKFWATWCRPCIETIPELNKLIHEHESDKRISFITICLDSEKNKWLNILKKYGVKGTNLYADENWSRTLRTNFNINGIPHYALIGKNNALIENKTAVAPAVKTKIEKILSDEKPIVK